MSSILVPEPLTSQSAIQDAVRAFQAQPTTARGLGAATRELVVGPVSYGMGRAADLANPVGDFFGGLTASSPSPSPSRPSAAPKPIIRAPDVAQMPSDRPEARSAVIAEMAAMRPGNVAYGDPARGFRRGPLTSSSAVGPDGARMVTIGDGSTAADAVLARPPADPNIVWVDGRQLGRGMADSRGREAAARARDPSYQAARAAYDAGSVTPSLQPISSGPKDPAEEYLKMRNNGTWDGLFAAKKYARLLEGNRTAADAAARTASAIESARLGSIATLSNAESVARRTDQDQRLTDSRIAESAQRQRAGELDLADREETENLRRLAAQGDPKALARYRQLSAARQGKDPATAANEKLLDAYIRSTAEFSKDPTNMGKPAPTFQEFLGGLPPDMFPHIAQYLGASQPLPPGAVKKLGTSNGRPVYLMRDGRQMVSAQ